MQLSRYEKETVINFNEEEKTATVYTHNVALQHKLARIAESRPGECVPQGACHEGQAQTYVVPKKWIKVNPSRLLTEEQKEKARENAERTLKARMSTKSVEHNA